jgi:hypothetical protein
VVDENEGSGRQNHDGNFMKDGKSDSTEGNLVRRKAARMGISAVLEEMARINRGLGCAQCAAARKRYEFRLGVCREIARAVAADLLRNGAGDVAKRLVLELENGHDGGGWSRAGIESRVEAVVKAHIERSSAASERLKDL